MDNDTSYITRLCALCELATTNEIHSWSFGAITVRAPRSDISWQSQRGSLDDQAIFGPLNPYRCACGKHSGHHHAEGICDICGVKITSSDSRWSRFGHINLSVPIPHDICPRGAMIEAFPVLPAAVRLSGRGDKLNALYEEMLDDSILGNARTMHSDYRKICNLLLPVIMTAIEWNLKDAVVLAKGLALILKAEQDASVIEP